MSLQKEVSFPNHSDEAILNYPEIHYTQILVWKKNFVEYLGYFVEFLEAQRCVSDLKYIQRNQNR